MFFDKLNQTFQFSDGEVKAADEARKLCRLCLKYNCYGRKTAEKFYDL
jgi:hypothetical protein